MNRQLQIKFWVKNYCTNFLIWFVTLIFIPIFLNNILKLNITKINLSGLTPLGAIIILSYQIRNWFNLSLQYQKSRQSAFIWQLLGQCSFALAGISAIAGVYLINHLIKLKFIYYFSILDYQGFSAIHPLALWQVIITFLLYSIFYSSMGIILYLIELRYQRNSPKYLLTLISIICSIAFISIAYLMITFINAHIFQGNTVGLITVYGISCLLLNLAIFISLKHQPLVVPK